MAEFSREQSIQEIQDALERKLALLEIIPLGPKTSEFELEDLRQKCIASIDRKIENAKVDKEIELGKIIYAILECKRSVGMLYEFGLEPDEVGLYLGDFERTYEGLQKRLEGILDIGIEISDDVDDIISRYTPVHNAPVAPLASPEQSVITPAPAPEPLTGAVSDPLEPPASQVEQLVAQSPPLIANPVSVSPPPLRLPSPSSAYRPFKAIPATPTRPPSQIGRFTAAQLVTSQPNRPRSSPAVAIRMINTALGRKTEDYTPRSLRPAETGTVVNAAPTPKTGIEKATVLEENSRDPLVLAGFINGRSDSRETGAKSNASVKGDSSVELERDTVSENFVAREEVIITESIDDSLGGIAPPLVEKESPTSRITTWMQQSVPPVSLQAPMTPSVSSRDLEPVLQIHKENEQETEGKGERMLQTGMPSIEHIQRSRIVDLYD